MLDDKTNYRARLMSMHRNNAKTGLSENPSWSGVMPQVNPYRTGLDKNSANHVPLSPVGFLERAAQVFPDRVSVIHGTRRFNCRESNERCRRLASALHKWGIGKGDTVAVMAPNIPALFEAHFGIPMTGAVINALNIRLDAATIAFILEHGEARVLLTDREFSPVVRDALARMAQPPRVIDIDDPLAEGGELIGEIEYEAFLQQGDPAYRWEYPDDEWDAIALNYTSGTTGNPKGVVYHHRGAHLINFGNILAWNMTAHPVYLWTLPMFHCNGWCFPWTITALYGTHVCMRKVTAKTIYQAIAEHQVSHFCGAPIILNLLTNASGQERRAFDHQVHIMTAAAPPPPSVLETMEAQGFHITHVYGLTEVYGPAVACDWHQEWDVLPANERAQMRARQGVRYAALEGLMVADPATLEPVPSDGQTLGEVFMRGNIVMKGYLKNPVATRAAFDGGWFHSGDLGVMHPDGYIQLKDRSKDIIISGGENISTIEVEGALYRHPAVLEAAVVGQPDEKWGETPCAFVCLKAGAQVSEEELVAFCRDHLAHFKVPRRVIFGALPKTSTGKVQKFKLRKRLPG